MDKTHEIIDAFNQLLYDIYEREGFRCLSDNNYIFQDKNVLGLSNRAVVQSVANGIYEKLKNVNKELKLREFNYMHAENELITVTADLKYRLGILHLYHPYIVNLHESYYWHQGKKQHFYNQTRNDARFNRELPVAFENLYKFWQRLSDYLLTFFPDAIFACSGKSFFHTFFQHIEKYHANLIVSNNYKWLKNFEANHYPILNKKRKFFVHTAGYDNLFFSDFLKNIKNNEQEMFKLDEERKQLLNYLKEQLEFCLVGYIKGMSFLNELTITSSNEDKELHYSLKVA